MRPVRWILPALTISLLTGCGHFFTKESGGGGGGGNATHTLYAASGPSGSNGTLSAFTINSAGTLTSTGASASVSVSPRSIVITPNNQFLYVANQTGLVNAFNISGSTINPVPNTPTVSVGNPVALAVNSAGSVLYVLNLNIGAPTIASFRIQSDGSLATSTGQALNTTSGTPADLALSPSGNFLYVAADSDTAIFKVALDQSRNPSFTQVTCTASCTIPSKAVLAHPNGNFLYVADGSSRIAAYSLDSNGVPTLLTTITGLANPNSLSFDSAANFLLSTTSGDSTLTSFAVLQSGTIAKVTSVRTGGSPVQVRVDPNTNTAFTVNSGGSPDISGFSVSNSGQLTAAGNANISGNASALAITH